MFEYIVQYKNLSVLVRTESKADILKNIIKVFNENHDIDIVENDFCIHLYHELIQDYYLPPSLDCLPSFGKLKLIETKEPSESLSTPGTSNAVNQQKTNCIVYDTPDEISTWPTVYIIPIHNMSASLKASLNSEKLSPSHERELLRVLYSDITTYNL